MKLNVYIKTLEDEQNICGVKNNNIKVIEQIYGCFINITGGFVEANVDENTSLFLETLFHSLIKVSELKYQITERDILYIDKLIKEGKSNDLISLYETPQTVGKKINGKQIVPKTLNQKIYVNELTNKNIVFGVGPAGTGKTYLAVAYAVNMFKTGDIKKLILTRPAVEAGESLGYLPGDLKEKIDPYLRPLYDALYDTLGLEQTNALIEKGTIEIAPLAYMRGRTLENACIILDEAQNTTNRQMKMFLTRMGFNSKMIITGDISQIDLPKGVKSGLIHVIDILKDIDEVGIVKFDLTDVVRHPLVAKILDRYEEYEEK